MKRLAVLCSLCLVPLLAQRPELSKHYLGVREPLTSPSSRPARDIALDHIRSLASELNLVEPDLASLYIAKEYVTAHNGVHHIVFKQQFQGIDVLNAEWVVNIDSDGSVLNSGGNLYAAPPPDLPLPAQSSAMSAVRVAVRGVNPKLAAGFLPFVSARPAAGTNGVRFTAGPLPEEIDGELVWYALRGQLHPAWLFYIVDEDGINSYATVVDDGSQSILSKLLTAERIRLRARKPPIESDARRAPLWTTAARAAHHAVADWRSRSLSERLGDRWRDSRQQRGRRRESARDLIPFGPQHGQGNQWRFQLSLAARRWRPEPHQLCRRRQRQPFLLDQSRTRPALPVRIRRSRRQLPAGQFWPWRGGRRPDVCLQSLRRCQHEFRADRERFLYDS